MKKYILTLIAIIASNILFGQEVKTDSTKLEKVDSIQIVVHANDFRILLEKLDSYIDSKSATMEIINFLNRHTRKIEAVKPKQPAKPNKEQPK